MSKKFLVIPICGALIFLFALSGCSKPYFPPPANQGEWRKNTDPDFIRSLGIDPAKLDSFGRWNIQNNWSGSSHMFKSCLVIKDGWIIGEWYGTKDGQFISTQEGMAQKARLASNGKAVAITLFGIINKEAGTGNIPSDISPGSKVYDQRWLPEGFPLSDKRKEQITFEDIMHHRSGIMPESAGEDRFNDKSSILFTVGHDTISPESEKLYYDPGHPEQYLPLSTYSSVAFNHFTIIFRHLTGIPAWRSLENKLFHPIGIYDIGYSTDLQKSISGWLNDSIRWITSGGLWLRPRDYARFAYLLLHDGKWDGHQMVNKDWIPHFRLSNEYPNFWSNKPGGGYKTYPDYPEDDFMIGGSGMNWAYIMPGKNMIVIRTGQIYNVPWEPVRQDYIQKIYACFTNDPRSEPPRKSFSKNAMQGQIIVDPSHPEWLVYNRDDDHDGLPDPYFLCGPGDPEGFLYRGRLDPDGTRHGDQVNMIDKLANYGGNSIYMIAVRTNGGDALKESKSKPDIYPDAKQNPWIGQDPAKGLNPAVMDQWDEWFNLMDHYGITIYIFIYDDAIKIADEFGWKLDANGKLDPREKEFIQALVKRLEHHKNLIWCVMEEAQEAGPDWKSHISEIAKAIREADDYDHVIASHQLPGNVFYHANDPDIDQFAIQTNLNVVKTTDDFHKWILQAWDNAKGRYSLNMSEDAVQGNISVPEKNRTEIRQRNWAAAMAGAYSMVLGMNISDTPELWLLDCRTLQNFFESTLFNYMHPEDSLAYEGTDYVLDCKPYAYIAYSMDSIRDPGIRNMEKGTYDLEWVDCITGVTKRQQKLKIQAGNQVFKKPMDFSNETALYIHRTDKTMPPDINTHEKAATVVTEEEENRVPLTEDRSINTVQGKSKYIQLVFDDPDGGPGPYTISLITEPKHGKLTGAGNDKYYSPDGGYTGTDYFTWKVNDGEGDSKITRVTITIK